MKKERKEDCLYKSVCNNECFDGCPRYNGMKRLLELSNLPKAQQCPHKIYNVDIDAVSYAQLNDIKTYIVEFVRDGKDLFICSNYCGNGKTTWAVKMMLKYFDRTWENSYDVTRALFVHVPTLLIDLRNVFNPEVELPEYISRIAEADLVVWDDFASSDRISDYIHEQLLRMIDYRISMGKSNIYTSNVTTLNELSKIVGDRLSSRVFAKATVIELQSKVDFRIGGVN